MTDKPTDLKAFENVEALDEMREKLNALSSEKRDHFLFTVNALMNCYIDEKERALLLVTGSVKSGIDNMSLIAINANEDETEDLIDTLCVFRKLDFKETGNFAN